MAPYTTGRRGPLALTALAAVALLIPAVVGAVLAAPFLPARRQRRSHDRLSGEAQEG
jgi:hypothetical protein